MLPTVTVFLKLSLDGGHFKSGLNLRKYSLVLFCIDFLPCSSQELKLFFATRIEEINLVKSSKQILYKVRNVLLKSFCLLAQLRNGAKVRKVREKQDRK